MHKSHKSRKSRKSHKYSTKKHRKSYKNKKMSRRIYRGGNPYLTSNSVKEQWDKRRASLQSAIQNPLSDRLLFRAKNSAERAETASKEVFNNIRDAARHYGSHIFTRGKEIFTENKQKILNKLNK